MHIAADLNQLLDFRDEARDASACDLKLIALADQREWSIAEGVLSHRTRGFFHVAGAVNDSSGEERLVLHQPQAAITCLAVHVQAGRIHVLSQARGEPGNCEEVQYGPTIQSTPANFLGLHGGQPVNHLDCFIDSVPRRARPLAQSSQLDLGNRYFQKIKTLMYAEVADWLDTAHDLIWVPLDVLAGGLLRDHLLNIDFRSMLACFDWDTRFGPRRASGPAVRAVAPALEARTDAADPERGWRLSGLDELSRWEITRHGVEPCDSGEVGVRMYRATCRGREVGEWSQPLFEAAGVGEVALCVRIDEEGRWAFLLSRVRDAGLAGGFAWTTSIDRAPDEANDLFAGFERPERSSVLRSIHLSEEGGRFLRNSNRYEIVRVDDESPIGAGQHWVDEATLRAILQASNQATIHLRCAASLVLDVLHPCTFGHAPASSLLGPSRQSAHS